ncbi:hypothetical protein ACIQNG_23685 [Streptomyces sp. NPDC091377]|uniref:hypothetical protein n=1 Tax=unclassified Streptomyces TaxID=2593676 RepID=UPI003819A7A0
MYEYEYHQSREADLIRRAEQERLAREAVRQARAARREADLRAQGREAPGEDTHHPRRRFRSPRAA